MKKSIFFILFIFTTGTAFSQGRTINKLTLETTYSYVEISKALRDLIDHEDKPAYFDDAFFNGMLKKIITDKKYTEKEKVQLFYLMQKKLGFAFVGVNYMPPKHNYFIFFMGEVLTLQKTRADLRDLNYDARALLSLVDSNYSRDPVLSSNALLLAAVLNPGQTIKSIEQYSKADVILAAKNPGIFNHYLCLSATLRQTPAVAENLIKNIMSFRNEEFIEDALCALYSGNNPVSTIKDYILAESDPKNDLSIQTALCVLHTKVPQATFENSVKEFSKQVKEKWKKELFKNILEGKVPFNYSLAEKELVVIKTWEGVTLSLYNDGSLISNGSLMEFEPN